jgi:hypothetical protein
MDLEITTPISTDDESTMHSTQDRPSVQVHHHQDISSNLYNKKKKYMNLSIILTPMKIMMLTMKFIKIKCGSLRTNERSIPLPQILQSVLDLMLTCVYLYVAWFLCRLYVML